MKGGSNEDEKMQNAYVQLGAPFNVRQCVFVVGIYGIITIISYFNELSKAGLLFGKAAPAYRHIRSNKRDMHSSIHDSDSQLDLRNIKQLIRTNSNQSQEINIALHLGKNASYETANHTLVKVYQHKNVLPNYYINFPFADENEIYNTSAVDHHVKQYLNSTKVLLYQHGSKGYCLRDCFKNITRQSRLEIAPWPLNLGTRAEWEEMSDKQKSSFDVLYGGLSFGVCESISRPCNYFAMFKHPLDRILHVFFQCRIEQKSSFCKFDKLNITTVNLMTFIKSQSGSLFKKLLYYNKHCKLLGDDEVCLHGSKAFFVLSSEERKAHLEQILEHMESWFSVIGLSEHLGQSFQLFQHVFHMNFTSCLKTKIFDIDLDDVYDYTESLKVNDTVTYTKLREVLLNDTHVKKWLKADILIYEKAKSIFFKQMEIVNKFGINFIKPSTISQQYSSTIDQVHTETSRKYKFIDSKSGNVKNVTYSKNTLKLQLIPMNNRKNVKLKTNKYNLKHEIAYENLTPKHDSIPSNEAPKLKTIPDVTNRASAVKHASLTNKNYQKAEYDYEKQHETGEDTRKEQEEVKLKFRPRDKTKRHRGDNRKSYDQFRVRG